MGVDATPVEHPRDIRPRGSRPRANRGDGNGIVQSTPTLTARYLEELSRMQSLLVEEVACLSDGTAVGPLDPRPAIVGAAFACLTAAQAPYQAFDQSRPFPEFSTSR